MKYICEDCGRQFDEPKTIKDCIGYFWGEPAEEEYKVCPFCKSSGYVETEKCEYCHEDFHPNDVPNCICAECLGKEITQQMAIEFIVENDLFSDFCKFVEEKICTVRE